MQRYAKRQDRHRHQRTSVTARSTRPSRPLQSSHCSQATLAVPRTRTVFASRAFSVAAPTVWNLPSDNVVNSDTSAAFRNFFTAFLVIALYYEFLSFIRSVEYDVHAVCFPDVCHPRQIPVVSSCARVRQRVILVST